jgi:hypothetical protein
MADSDMIFGWVEIDGAVNVVDAYSTGPLGPHPADTEQGGTDDILTYGGREENGATTIEFTRKLDTGDEYDNPIPSSGKLKIIWAAGSSDDFNSKHGSNWVGYGTIDIASGETTSEEPVELWPYHAIFLTLGAGGMVLGTIALYRRKWKLFLKFHMWIMAAAVGVALIGVIIGVVMVENSTGVHFRVPHSYFGPLTFLVSLFALGIGFYFKYTKNMKHKRPTRTIHLYAGWAGAGLFIMTTISGFIQALVTAEEEPPVWFLVIMGLIIALLIGIGIYVIMMGRKKPPVKKPEPSLQPEVKSEEDDIPPVEDSEMEE